jgi:hypothetical protein
MGYMNDTPFVFDFCNFFYLFFLVGFGAFAKSNIYKYPLMFRMRFIYSLSCDILNDKD